MRGSTGLVVVLWLGMLGCAVADEGSAPSSADPTTSEATPRERTVHVRVRLEVSDVAAAARRVRAELAEREGYVEAASERPSGEGHAWL